MTITRIAANIALGLLAACSIAAQAQKFPEKPITLIVPWPAGGSTDLSMRAVAEGASKHLPQRVVIENRPGASGTLGAVFLAQNARPDGYTVSQMPITVFRHPHMTKTQFDPMVDFTWIIHLTGYTFGVVVRADSPFKTFKDLVEYARANPGKVSYGTPGNGTSLHITMEQVALKENIQWLQIPFKGYADNATSLLGGHTMALADSTGWAEQVNGGKMRLLVTWGDKRTKRWPDTPTLKDLGYGIVSDSPYGLAGPKGMDPAVVRILHDAFKKGLEDPETQKMLERFDQANAYLDSAGYAAHAKKTFEEEDAMIKRLGLKM
jgi:tripartite-type tricarboxylate transporter receptor subunit TctC